MGGPDADLPTRLERVSNAFMLDWLSEKEGVELVPVGNAVAALSPSEPELDFVNRIYGVPPSLREALPPYGAAALRPWLERRPGAAALARAAAGPSAHRV